MQPEGAASHDHCHGYSAPNPAGRDPGQTLSDPDISKAQLTCVIAGSLSAVDPVAIHHLLFPLPPAYLLGASSLSSSSMASGNLEKKAPGVKAM
jgi:hypothetical protein